MFWEQVVSIDVTEVSQSQWLLMHLAHGKQRVSPPQFPFPIQTLRTSYFIWIHLINLPFLHTGMHTLWLPAPPRLQVPQVRKPTSFNEKKSLLKA